MRHSSLAFGFVLIVAAGASAAATTSPTNPAFPSPGLPQGGFEVQALVDGFWSPVADLSFGRHFREALVELPAAALASPRVRVRLVQHGGGAAHIDEVSLGATAPTRLEGAAEPEALALGLRRDHDVLDAFGRTIEVSFAASRLENPLRLTARVEGPVVEGSPFAFPPQNQFQELTAGSSFYRFTPAPEGRAPAWPEALDPKDAFFSERCVPTTGHPAGLTLGWIANDQENLYAAVEFTPDNTRDGDADWAGIQVVAGGEIREFRVSEEQTRWGLSRFGPTARAGYRHKLYTFAIPFAELGIRNPSEAGELKLAFSAYGTAAIAWLSPLFHDFGTVFVGSAAPAATFTIFNGTQQGMVLGTPWYTRAGPNSAVFPIAPGTCSDGLAIPAGGGCSFEVGFAPASAGAALNDIVVSAAFGTAPPVQETIRVQGNGLLEGIPALGVLGGLALALVLGGAGTWLLRRG